MHCYICNEPIESNQSRMCDWMDSGAHYVHRKCQAEAQKPRAVLSNSTDGLCCPECGGKLTKCYSQTLETNVWYCEEMH